MKWMGRRDANPKKGAKERIPFLGLVTVLTSRRNAKRMQIGGMQIIVLLARLCLSQRLLESFQIIQDKIQIVQKLEPVVIDFKALSRA
jgi:hypothetical protein